jgi:hypothetical protein
MVSPFGAAVVEAEVELTDGTLIKTRCDGPKGVWGPTRHQRLSMRLPSDRMERCIALARQIETLGPDGVSELMSIASLLS